jgi:hypothetical protein
VRPTRWLDRLRAFLRRLIVKSWWKRTSRGQVTSADPVEPSTVVGTAEEIVGAAWMGELLSAIEDAETAVRACLHMREQAGAGLRAALVANDPRRIAETQSRIDTVEQSLAETIATYDVVRELLAREQADRPFAAWVRVVEG